MMDTPRHVSVLLDECIENLASKPDGIYVDGTLGLGGHSYEIAKRLTTGRLIGIDRDETAIERAGKRLSEFSDKVTLVHGNFSDTAAILDSLGIDAVDGMLFDLGVSSPQLDEAERGFSYMNDAPLDMRMDRQQKLTELILLRTAQQSGAAAAVATEDARTFECLDRVVCVEPPGGKLRRQLIFRREFVPDGNLVRRNPVEQIPVDLFLMVVHLPGEGRRSSLLPAGGRKET